MINGYAAKAALTVLDKLNIQSVEKHLEFLSSVAAEEIKKSGLINLSSFSLSE